MVRIYKRKTQRASQYSQADLENAVREIKRGAMTLYRAYRLYGIPKTTLFYHVTGARGQKSRTQGRAPAIPFEDEKRLAQGLKTMELWGFGISRKELYDIVAEYVTKNEIKTPFRNNTPGNEWFLNFKKRHNLSIKKPQSVEYSRKKMTDPFVVNEYFNLLKKTLNDLNLQDKPEAIWNLDETSLSHDPCKTKVVGARGKPSSRTTSGPGRETTTILSAVSASGLKAPPLIIFKGKNVWDSWLPSEANSFKGTAYAASPNGWMEADIFYNYFEKTLLPALGPTRPALIIFDGHSTHVNIPLIELARANDIIILKLPPHTSHLLQPLDLAVFKSVKVNWDLKLVAWQRQNIGLKIPKKVFSELIGITWKNLDPEIIRNGFRKGGIFPFSSDVISEDRYDPEALKRWKISQQALTNETNATDIANENNSAEKSDSVNESNFEKEQDKTINKAGPSRSSFEELLLNTVKQTQRDCMPVKRRKIAGGAEVITSQDVLERLVKEKEEKGKKKNSISSRKCNKKTKTVRKRKRVSSSSSDESVEDNIVLMDSEDDIDPEIFEEETEDASCLSIGVWVIVEYASKRTIKHFVGQIKSREEDGWFVTFLKYRNNAFTWPEIEDMDTVVDEDIIKILPTPTIDRRNSFHFPVNFDGLHL